MNLDFERDLFLNEQARKLLTDYYLHKNEKSPQEGFARAATAFSNGDKEFAQRIYDYASNGWFMFSSPILSNAGANDGSLPISCFLNYVPDNLEGLIEHSSETRWLSVKGGGVGGHWSDVRSVSDKAPGPMPFLHTIDADMVAYRQGKTRKGSYAAYMDISHPDIIEFINMRIPTGDVNRKNLNTHHGVNIPDAFMEAVEKNESWDLVDPKTKEVKETLLARKVWELILETRYRTGEPYLHFIDTSNAALPKEQKELGLRINGSNLCNEIFLSTNSLRTAVCCLLSVNLEYYDDWKNTNMIADLICFLDNVLQYFIDNAPDEIKRARYSAYRERSVGLGAMGFHSYLQRNNVAFESEEARVANIEIFKDIYNKSYEESLRLGKLRGEAPDMVGSGLRNAHRMAIAPNANSSMILSTSPSIEPWKANAFTSRTRVGSHLNKNKYLEIVLEQHNKNNDEIWSSIIVNGGSVQHLDFLTKHEKEVFKTAIEIDQETIVRLAGERQNHICQGQSLNVFFPAGVDKKYLNKVHYMAWKYGCKGMYYLRTESSNKAEVVSEKVKADKINFLNGEEEKQDECTSCQG